MIVERRIFYRSITLLLPGENGESSLQSIVMPDFTWKACFDQLRGDSEGEAAMRGLLRMTIPTPRLRVLCSF